MKLTNYTIEEIINILSDANSFRNDINIKIPAKLRYAIRVNEQALQRYLQMYREESQKILQGYVEKGYVTIEGSNYRVKPEYISEVDRQLTELAMVETDIKLELVDKDIVNRFLETVDISVPEEKILLLFAETGPVPAAPEVTD